MQTNSTGDYQDFLTRDYVNELTKRIHNGASVLDLGCGTGVLTLQLGLMGYRVSSLDISEAMLGQLKSKAKDLPIELFQGDIFNLPFRDEKFDGIITRWVFPHFPEWSLAVNEASRVLKSGGIFVFDMTSDENYKFANANKTLDLNNFGYNPYNKNAKNYYASSNINAIEDIAKKSNLNIIKIIPNGFYRTNAIIASALGADAYENFKDKFNDYYKNESIKEFIQWFDLNVTKKLPTELVNTLTIVTQKNELKKTW